MNKRIRDDTQAARKKLKTEDGEEPVGDELDALVAAVDGLKHLGRAIAPPFRKLPPKQQYPDYYQLIKKPIAIESIRQNLKQGEYLTLDMLKQDLLQMTNNAKRYNEKGSGLYLDAKLISSLVKTWGGGQAAPSSSDDEAAPLTMKQKIAWILQKLHQVFDGERRLAEIFSVLPDKEMYPDYYKIIKRPISLKEIDKDNKRGNYKNIDKFADDLEQMYTNALTFNEDQSIVAQDARALKELSDKLIADVRA
ncbi:Bromodomain-containing protein, partial [Protomyces lactucae-debilis]